MENSDKQGIAIIIICGILISIITLWFFNSFETTTYEYAINGVIKESKECYQRGDEMCFCKEGNNFIQVDSYYEVENEK